MNYEVAPYVGPRKRNQRVLIVRDNAGTIRACRYLGNASTTSAEEIASRAARLAVEVYATLASERAPYRLDAVQTPAGMMSICY